MSDTFNYTPDLFTSVSSSLLESKRSPMMGTAASYLYSTMAGRAASYFYIAVMLRNG